MKRKRRNQLMTEGSAWKNLLIFSIPLLVGNLFQQLYNTADSVVVGNYIGKEALAAVGSSNSLINLIVGLFMGIATGSGVIISKYYGAKDMQKMQWAVHTAIALSIIGGVALTVAGVILSPLILSLMGTPEEVMVNSVLYLRIFFCGSLFNLVYNMGAGILRGVGDSKRPLYFLCVASAVNIALDLLFVVGFGMGVEGVAYATIIAQAVSAALVLYTLMGDDDIYRLHYKRIKIDPRMMKRILGMGIPSGLQSAVVSFSNVIIQTNINSFGADAMAGCSSYMKIDGFAILPIMSFGMAAMTFTGQNIGAGEMKRVKKGLLGGLAISMVYTVLISGTLYLFGSHLLRVFSDDPEVNAYGLQMLRMLVPFYWSLSIAQLLTGVLRGAGKATAAMLLIVGSMVGMRMLWVQVMMQFIPTLETVLWGYPVSWIAAMIGTTIYMMKSNWLRSNETAATK